MLAEPPPTQADIHFRVAGFPVRVHPFFWLIALLIGINAVDGDSLGALLAVVVVFVSILVHELGHAVLQRRFGGRPRIVLHGFGGLAICGDCDRSPRSQILISLAGPAAGFLLAAVTAVVVAVTSGGVAFVPAWSTAGTDRMIPVNLLIGTLYYKPYASLAVSYVVFMLLRVNIFWGLMNLLPVYPLDGGQVAREVMTLGPNPQQGTVRSLQVSIGVAVVVAVWGLWAHGLWLGVLFGYLAYTNYRMLQAYTGRGPGMGWG